MKPYVFAAQEKLLHGCARAEGLKSIFEYIKGVAPGAMDCSDILRSSLMLTVSSFDLFVHEIYRLEVLERLKSGREIQALKVPFKALVADEHLRINIIDECVRSENSYKSFVAPDKLSECLKIIIDSPWDKISRELERPVSEIKANLKGVVDLRNRIAHEADVNPAYAGIELWPIYISDVTSSIVFIRDLGCGIARIVDSSA